MTERVDFYVLSQGAPDARMRCACHLAEKAVGEGRCVYLLTSSIGEAQRLDELLWTFNDRSFLPHEIYSGQPPSHARVSVLLGPMPGPDSHRDLLVNLTESVPVDYERYQRIAEIVDTDAERKRNARERYKRYRELGLKLETTNL
ncbi:MAG TPA: DNA polymerase III subunit chi [Steroidobacteraceae bacterium]